MYSIDCAPYKYKYQLTNILNNLTSKNRNILRRNPPRHPQVLVPVPITPPPAPLPLPNRSLPHQNQAQQLKWVFQQPESHLLLQQCIRVEERRHRPLIRSRGLLPSGWRISKNLLNCEVRIRPIRIVAWVMIIVQCQILLPWCKII